MRPSKFTTPALSSAHSPVPILLSKMSHSTLQHVTTPSRRWLVASCLSLSVFVASAHAADEPFRPEAGKFPPIEKAHAYRGELVFVDHANRRGSIRVEGGGVFRMNDPHPFAMLPYGQSLISGLGWWWALMILAANACLILPLAIPLAAQRAAAPAQRQPVAAALAEARAHQSDGQFPPGSMGPKIAAAIRFLERGGERAIITSLDRAFDALEGRAGTHIVPA